MSIANAIKGVNLRPYQADLLDRALAATTPCVVQLPTGGGKTEIALGLLEAVGGNGLVVVHRQELLEQWIQRRDKAGLKDAVRVTTIQSTNPMPAPDTTVIFDEAHHFPAGKRGGWGAWQSAVLATCGRVWGFTATPYRLSRTQGFSPDWRSLVLGPSIGELVDAGWLAQFAVMTHPLLAGAGLVVKRTGDYDLDELEDTPILTGQAVEWLGEVGVRNVIVYAVSKGHADLVVSLLTAAGWTAEVLVSGRQAKTARRAIVERFRTGQTNALVNVEIVTEGFDVPATDAVLMLRPTMSLGLYLQMAGRAMRPKPGGGMAYILDATDNSERLGNPLLSPIDWSLHPRGSKVSAPAPTKKCRNPRGCKAINHAAAQECVACGWAFGKVCATCGRWRPWRLWGVQVYCHRCDEVRTAWLAERRKRRAAGKQRAKQVAIARESAQQQRQRAINEAKAAAELRRLGWRGASIEPRRWGVSRNGNVIYQSAQLELRATLKPSNWGNGHWVILNGVSVRDIAERIAERNLPIGGVTAKDGATSFTIQRAELDDARLVMERLCWGW